MVLELSPQIEARLTAAAHQHGIEPTVLAETLLSQSLPPAPTEPAPVVDEENAAAITLLRSWLAAAPTDPEEIRQAEAERNEFMENLNRNRIESGERPLFP